MYGLKIAGTDQVSFGPVPVLMVDKVIWSTAVTIILLSAISNRSEYDANAQCTG